MPWLTIPCLFVGAATALRAQRTPAAPAIDDFFAAAEMDDSARARIAAAWDDGYAGMVVDLLDLMRRTGLVDPFSWIRLISLAQFLEDQTGERFGADVNAWHDWIWSRPYEPHPEYGTFKGRLYAQLDERFEQFFQPPVRSTIRLDEVDWGGVGVNGIPPLDHPLHLTAPKATYMEDDHDVVFGLYLDDVARAYPKRILAWHELARDTLGSRSVTVVYCTLCGTVIPYDSRVGGKLRTFGTSGLLYQSNKLMFDEETNSLWSSLTGTPVIGPLAGSGLRLSMLPVVTTTWGEWRRIHPDTTVLSLDTGFTRDYSEGAAYRQYFATDRLMFRVSRTDARLRNKAEVLALRLPGESGADPRAVAISAEFLEQNPVYHVDVAEPRLVVITTAGGANRVYQSGAHRLSSVTNDGRILDSRGRAWTMTEDALQATFEANLRLPRVPAHRAFWFGWYAQHPDTLLIT